MKKFLFVFVLFIIFVLCMFGCNLNRSLSTDYYSSYYSSDNPSMFIVVEENPYFSVVYHRYTKVMYSVSCGDYNHGTFTVLLNSDGTPMLYSE